MPEPNLVKPPVTFWIIGILALIWYGMTLMNFVFQMSPEFVASLPESHRMIIENRPAWATAGFALTAFAGVLGCLLLLLRRRASLILFAVSAIGVILTLIPVIGLVSRTLNLAAGEFIAMVIMPLVAAVLLVLYARRAITRLWIR